MCLATISGRYPVSKPLKVKSKAGRYKIGWKWVVVDARGWSAPLQHGWPQKPYPFNKWITDTSKAVVTSDVGMYDAENDRVLNDYKAGFHIFETRQDARTFKFGNGRVVKVHYQDVVATGTQNCGNVVVARKIRIPKEQ